ncbi:MAG: flagellar motor switch protein FliG, partial [Rhodocyclaceae bacterium]|nr:flagellar motor switch protein FliG [Rhodocyclaceae bacterium]
MGSEDGITKSAMLLITLGEDEAAEVLKHLGPREVQKLGAAMAALKSVPRDKVEDVVDEFYQETQRGAPMVADEEYIRGMLTKALG